MFYVSIAHEFSGENIVGAPEKLNKLCVETAIHMDHHALVVGNARGYARDGVNENPLFDSNFVVQIRPSAQGAYQE